MPKKEYEKATCLTAGGLPFPLADLVPELRLRHIEGSRPQGTVVSDIRLPGPRGPLLMQPQSTRVFLSGKQARLVAMALGDDSVQQMTKRVEDARAEGARLFERALREGWTRRRYRAEFHQLMVTFGLIDAGALVEQLYGTDDDLDEVMQAPRRLGR